MHKNTYNALKNSSQNTKVFDFEISTQNYTVKLKGIELWQLARIIP